MNLAEWSAHDQRIQYAGHVLRAAWYAANNPGFDVLEYASLASPPEQAARFARDVEAAIVRLGWRDGGKETT